MITKTLLEFITFNDWPLLLIVAIPWLLGVVIILDIIGTIYTSWLWKGIEDEDRYFYIKASKW
jgi:hypothetical protein